MKICRDCKTEKPNSFFVRNKVCKDGIDTLDCNHLLGFAKDNTEILKNAIDYLQR